MEYYEINQFLGSLDISETDNTKSTRDTIESSMTNTPYNSTNKQPVHNSSLDRPHPPVLDETLRWSNNSNVIKVDQKKGDNPFLNRNIQLNRLGVSHNMPGLGDRKIDIGQSRMGMVDSRSLAKEPGSNGNMSSVENTRNNQISHNNDVKFIDYNNFSENYKNSKKDISDKGNDINNKMLDRDNIPSVSL